MKRKASCKLVKQLTGPIDYQNMAAIDQEIAGNVTVIERLDLE